MPGDVYDPAASDDDADAGASPPPISDGPGVAASVLPDVPQPGAASDAAYDPATCAPDADDEEGNDDVSDDPPPVAVKPSSGVYEPEEVDTDDDDDDADPEPAAKKAKTAGAAAEDDGEDDEDEEEEEEDEEAEEEAPKKEIRFRNYLPRDKELKKARLKREKVVVEDGDIPADAIEPPAARLEGEAALAGLLPQKRDDDLRRLVEPKLQLLQRRTQRAILQIVQERIKQQEQEEGEEGMEDDDDGDDDAEAVAD